MAQNTLDTSNIDAVLFDLDGTLCEYRIAPFDALEQALTAHTGALWRTHPEVFNRDNFRTQLDAIWTESDARVDAGQANPFPYGASTESVGRLLTQAGQTDPDVVERVRQAYLDTMVSHLHLKAGAKRVVGQLGGCWQTGLLTNGPSQLQWGKVAHLGIRHWFDSIVVSDDIGVRKPDPRIFEVALAALRVAARGAVYVGDTLQYDVLGAHNAGLRSVWINPQGRSLEAEMPEPDAQIDQLDELPAVLGLA